MKNARRVLSMVLCVLMAISMLTAIVLPVSAETNESVADPYEKVTTNPGTNEPTSNVYFVDPTWSIAPAVDENNQFEYKYVGNDRTYKLTWGENAFGAVADLNAVMKAYSEKWVADSENVSRDFVVVFAPGEYNEFKNSSVALSNLANDRWDMLSTNDLLNVYMLGAKAGKNPVNDTRDTKEDAKKIQNGRSVDPTKESVITDFFRFPSRSNCIVDGFAGTKNASLGSNDGGQYVNAIIKNFYMTDLTGPMNNKLIACSDTKNAFAIGDERFHRKIMWEFENCYLDFNQNTSVSSYSQDNFGDRKNNNVILSNKIIFDNCYISNTSSNDDFKFYLAPERQSSASMAPMFYGSYADNPEITFKNSIVNECVSKGLFIIDNTSNYFTSYASSANLNYKQGQVKINFENNKFYDVVSSTYPSSRLIKFTGWSNDVSLDNVITFNCSDNLFSVSKEREATLTGNNYIFGFSEEKNSGTDEEKEWQLSNVKIYNTKADDYDGAYPANRLLDGAIGNSGWFSRTTKNAYLTFQLENSEIFTKMVVHARALASCYDRAINNYKVYVSNKAPDYTGVSVNGTEVPTELGELVAEGSLKQVANNDLARTITFPENVKGQYVTLHIVDNQGSSVGTDLSEIQLFAGPGTPSLLNHFTIKENIFKFSNNGNVWMDSGNSKEPSLGLDLSGNLFVDNDGNVLSGPASKDFSEGYMNVQSDLYVSAAMKGGVRETLSVKDIKGGALLYNYVQINSTGKHFLGAVTLLLEDGKEYTADKNLFTFGDDKVVFEGVYSDEACTQKVEKLTQDMFANDAKYFLKASYSEEGTKATVIYALNSPMEYIVVTPEGSSSDQTKTYEFNGGSYANGVKSDDGVTAKFFTDIVDAIDEVDTTLAGEEKAANSSALAKATTATAFSLDSVILLTPGTYNVGSVAAQKALAIVGPKFNASPYDSQKNSEGKLAQGREINAEKEAILSGTFNNNFGKTGEVSANISICGIVWTSTEGALIEFTNQTAKRKSDYQIATLKNCIFSTLAKDGIITTNGLTEDSNLAVDVRVQDCVYYLPGTKHNSSRPLVDALAYRKAIENFSVISKNCFEVGMVVNDAHISNSAWTTKNGFAPVTDGIIYYVAEHIKGDLIVDTPSTCDQNGTGHYECLCGIEYPVEIKPHTLAGVATKLVVTKKPTCQENGVGKYVCAVCDIVVKDNVQIDKLKDHVAGDRTVDKGDEAGCNKTGRAHIDCIYCGKTLQEFVLPIVHNPGQWKMLQPGKEAKLCVDCGAILETRNALPSGTQPVPSDSTFEDVKKGDWYYNAVEYAAKEGLFAGVSDTEFAPNVKMTRAMFVTVLGRLHGIKGTKTATKFADVKKSTYYSGYVAWANKNGIVSGTSASTFAPNANITREQICTIMYRYCDYANITLKKVNKKVTFTDAKYISAYAEKAVTACQRGGLVNGKGGGKFDPKGQATRAEVATILMNFCKNYK